MKWVFSGAVKISRTGMPEDKLAALRIHKETESFGSEILAEGIEGWLTDLDIWRVTGGEEDGYGFGV